jgi:hypothetical protein
MARRSLPQSPLFGVSRFLVGDEPVTWEVSQREIEAETASAQRYFELLGIRAGERVLFISRLTEAPYFWPLERALLALGGQLASADASAFDAYRSAMFLRTLGLRAVIGLDAAVLAAMSVPGSDPSAWLRAVPTILARPDAMAALEAAGLRPLRMQFLGPALALERVPGAGAAVDPELWELGDDGGEIAVSSRIPRAMEFRRQRTGIRAAIDSRGGWQFLRPAAA